MRKQDTKNIRSTLRERGELKKQMAIAYNKKG